MSSSPSDVPGSLRASYAAAGQSSVFRFLDAGKLSAAESSALVAQLASIDVALVGELWRATMASEASLLDGSAPLALEPPSSVTVLAGAPEAGAWRAAGLQDIAAGRVAALTLAGGQGTRLGSARPKGEYDIGLPSGKCIFQLQAERLRTLRALAAAAGGGGGGGAPLPWYVMTSPMTDAETRATFAAAGNWGLPAGDVFIFSQGTLPVLDASGALLLERGGSVASAPDGNGGVYRALHVSGAMADMAARGVTAVHAFAVDNAIVRPADPVFIGFCGARGADVGSKVTPKAGPHERVGVLCRRGGAPAVVEYTELPRELAEARDAETGALRFNAGNLCMHYYSTAFLNDACAPATLPKVYHAARKAVPAANEASGAPAPPPPRGAPPNGVKLESFIFDVFPAARAMAALEIAREDEFAPVKNAPGEKEDSPDTARALVLAQHARWLRTAGATLRGGSGEAPPVAEVSPLLSYAGEGLERYAGAVIDCPALLLGRGERAEDFAAAAARGVNVVPFRD